MKRDHNAEASALPRLEFDLLMHGYFLRTFDPWIRGHDALELGCFEGSFTDRLDELFDDVTVIEASADCIAAARAKCPAATFIHSTFEDAEPGRKFNNIFCTHVLEHLDDPVAALNRISQWLTPEGRLFVAVPNAYAASRQIAVKMGLVESPEAVTPAEAAHGHRRTYSSEILRQHLNAAGLHIKDRGGVLFKALPNYLIDCAMDRQVIGQQYLDGCYELGKEIPEMCASLYAVCERGP